MNYILLIFRLLFPSVMVPSRDRADIAFAVVIYPGPKGSAWRDFLVFLLKKLPMLKEDPPVYD